MSDPMKVMVAIDFGPTAERAFRAALDLARRMGAELELVHVVPPLPALAAMGRANPVFASATDWLARYVTDAAAVGVVARAHVVEDGTEEGLLAAAVRLAVQMVVVGSHGRAGVTRALLGSVSDALCRRSAVPVLVVPAAERGALVERERPSATAVPGRSE